MSIQAPRKRDLIELMTGLGIVETHKGKYYVTQKFRQKEVT